MQILCVIKVAVLFYLGTFDEDKNLDIFGRNALLLHLPDIFCHWLNPQIKEQLTDRENVLRKEKGT